MESTQITPTFDQLPSIVFQMRQEIAELKNLLLGRNLAPEPEPDRWLTVEELRQYLPNHPAVQTVYGQCQKGLLPYHKKGKHLLFLKSEIDEYLKSGRVKTHRELSLEARSYNSTQVNKRSRGRRTV